MQFYNFLGNLNQSSIRQHTVYMYQPCKKNLVMNGQQKQQINGQKVDQLQCENEIKKFKEMFQIEREQISLRTLTAVQIPPAEPALGPRVEHIQIFTVGKLSKLISDDLDAPEGIAKLISLIKRYLLMRFDCI
eukprot:TRINITY_DN53530_c0_g1_i1.p1 TRINITY_DN53530_c0_g1~~TRINITY_DN53530_c0_g1_i1.p1  ORF type:complete len:133 (-),score=6.56 TRINITY_DN53530_c0_g1_i1:107-505(-)